MTVSLRLTAKCQTVRYSHAAHRSCSTHHSLASMFRTTRAAPPQKVRVCFASACAVQITHSRTVALTLSRFNCRLRLERSLCRPRTRSQHMLLVPLQRSEPSCFQAHAGRRLAADNAAALQGWVLATFAEVSDISNHIKAGTRPTDAEPASADDDAAWSRERNAQIESELQKLCDHLRPTRVSQRLHGAAALVPPLNDALSEAYTALWSQGAQKGLQEQVSDLKGRDCAQFEPAVSKIVERAESTLNKTQAWLSCVLALRDKAVEIIQKLARVQGLSRPAIEQTRKRRRLA